MLPDSSRKTAVPAAATSARVAGERRSEASTVASRAATAGRASLRGDPLRASPVLLVLGGRTAALLRERQHLELPSSLGPELL